MHALRRPGVLVLVVCVAGAVAGCASSSGSSQPAPGRTIAVQMNDQLRFSPDTLSVRTGETVQFQIQNTGSVAHEFLVADQPAQDLHERAMQGMGSGDGMHMSETNGVDVPPGESRTLTFTFPSGPGTLIYGCHVNGHYGAGMRGVITIG